MQANQEHLPTSILNLLTQLNQTLSQGKDITAITNEAINKLEIFDRTFNKKRDSKDVITNITKLYSEIISLGVANHTNAIAINNLLKKMAQTFSSIEKKRTPLPLSAKQASMFDTLMVIIYSTVGNYCLHFKEDDQALKHFEGGQIYALRVKKDTYLPPQLKEENVNGFYSMYYPAMSYFTAKKGKQDDAIEFANNGRHFYRRVTKDAAKVLPAMLLTKSYYQIALHAFAQDELEDAIFYVNETLAIVEEALKLSKVAYTITMNGRNLATDPDQETTQLLNIQSDVNRLSKEITNKLLERCQQFIFKILSTNGIKCDCTIQTESNTLKVSILNNKFLILLCEFLTKYKLEFNKTDSEINLKININLQYLQKIFLKFVEHVYKNDLLNAQSNEPKQKEDRSSSDNTHPHKDREETKHHKEKKKPQIFKPEKTKKTPKKVIEVQWNDKNYKPMTKDEPNRYFRIYGDSNIMTFGFFNSKKLLPKVPNQFTLDRGRTVAERGLVIPNGKNLGAQGIVFTKGQALTTKFSNKEKEYTCKVKLNGVLIDDRFLGHKATKGTLKIDGEKQSTPVELIEFDEYVHKAHKVAKV